MRTEKCRSCGALVIWAAMPSGKRAPFDADKVSREGTRGGWVLRANYGGDVYADRPLIKSQTTAEEYVHLSHFATCPDANDWRRSQR